MNLILIIGVCFAFLSAIFTGGYEDKPGKKKEKTRTSANINNVKRD